MSAQRYITSSSKKTTCSAVCGLANKLNRKTQGKIRGFHSWEPLFISKILEYFQVAENTQHDSKCDKNKATMPQESCQEMKNMRNDVEKVPDDEKSQDYSNSQNDQLEKLVKCNT